MGQEQSSPIDEATPPQTLKDRSVESIAKYVKEGKAKKIVVMVGAGISTSAGIPDFRSPETGLYANLARLDLPFAEAVFDISYFRNNPLPFYTLSRELYPGKYRPTISHSFVRLLSDKGLLLKLFTQNIDCLDREAGVPEDQIIEAHGSFASHHCIECRSQYPDDMMQQAVAKAEVPHCLIPQCNGLVKPDIVFFGEALPQKFHENRSLPSSADLCIVMGTSLTVQPFASLPSFCSEGVPRVLINLERVGGLGSRADDVLIIGECDDGVRKLAVALGWEKELENLWKETTVKRQEHNGDAASKAKDEELDDRILSLTQEVDKSLQISSEHDAKVRGQLAQDDQKRTESDATSYSTKSNLEGQARTENEDHTPEIESECESLGESGTFKEAYSRVQESVPMAEAPVNQHPSMSTNESKTSTANDVSATSLDTLTSEGNIP